MAETLLLKDFLDPELCGRIVAELEASSGSSAGVYGEGEGPRVDTRVRSAQLLTVSEGLQQRMRELFGSAQEQLGLRFGVTLSSFEEPKFLRYVEGDFFVAHQDGNTSLIRDDSLHRRVSVVLFLNSGYEGGELVLHGAYPELARRETVPAAPGTLAAFRSETTHEVTPVVRGVRYTIVTWYRA